MHRSCISLAARRPSSESGSAIDIRTPNVLRSCCMEPPTPRRNPLLKQGFVLQAAATRLGRASGMKKAAKSLTRAGVSVADPGRASNLRPAA